MGPQIDWSSIKKGREDYIRRYKTGSVSILEFPIVRSGKEVLKNLIRPGDSLLDIGANDRNLEKFLAGNGTDAGYFSFDIDKTWPHDYHSLEEIDRIFNICVAFDMVEHVPLSELPDLFTRIHGLLAPGGYFIVTTPNVCHPVFFWRDCTHITPLRYDELGGLFLSTGFKNVKLYRAVNLGFRKKIKYWMFKPLLDFLEIDFVRNIVMVAQA